VFHLESELAWLDKVMGEFEPARTQSIKTPVEARG
jgi:hypothetical protein